VHGDESDAVGGLADLARALIADQPLAFPAPSAPAAPDRPGVVLMLDDIVTDDGGACVLDGDGPCLSIVLETDQDVVATGSADAHATAAGSDVSGHSFIAFASGVTVYFPAELEVAVAPPLG
jgi:hypothetical protein